MTEINESWWKKGIFHKCSVTAFLFLPRVLKLKTFVIDCRSLVSYQTVGFNDAQLENPRTQKEVSWKFRVLGIPDDIARVLNPATSFIFIDEWIRCFCHDWNSSRFPEEFVTLYSKRVEKFQYPTLARSPLQNCSLRFSAVNSLFFIREENHLVFRDNTAKYMPFFKKHLQEYGFEVPPELDTPIPDLEPHSDPSPNRSSQLHDISSDIQVWPTEFRFGRKLIWRGFS